MSRIYTRTGDTGETALIGGVRVPKDHPRVAAYGNVDELNAMIGLAVSVIPRRRAFGSMRQNLERVQSELLHIGAVLATAPGKNPQKAFPEEAVAQLEREIDRMTADLPELKQFVLPGGTPSGAFLHAARTVCRRAERSALDLEDQEIPRVVKAYLNRLSDYLFTSARWANHKLKHHEARWKGLR